MLCEVKKSGKNYEIFYIVNENILFSEDFIILGKRVTEQLTIISQNKRVRKISILIANIFIEKWRELRRIERN